jgi:hypothetical protein
MLNQDIRNRKIVIKSEHFPRMCKERKHLFPPSFMLRDIYKECSEAIKNPLKGVFLEDNRKEENIQSNYICIFLGESGRIIALPCFINEEIVLFTIKDVEKEFGNPNWYIRGYNEIAIKRGLNPLYQVIKS